MKATTRLVGASLSTLALACNLDKAPLGPGRPAFEESVAPSAPLVLPSDPWSAPVNLGPTVNSTAFDGAPALSFDGTTLYFFSERTDLGGLGKRDLYVTTRTRLRGQDVAEHAKVKRHVRGGGKRHGRRAHEYPPEDQGAAPGADAAAQRRVQRFEWPQPAATDPNERPTSVALVKVWPDSLTLPVGAGW